VASHQNKSGEITSTLQPNEKKKDFSTAIASNDGHNLDARLQTMISALNVVERESPVTAAGVEVDLVQAAEAVRENVFDKVLLLMAHGEAGQYSPTGQINSPSLTGKGVGQILNLSRRIATFCNRDTGLVPELCVVSPSPCAAESALLSFPHLSPGSVNNIPWVSHEGCADRTNENLNVMRFSVKDLETAYPGINYSLVTNPAVADVKSECKTDELKRMNDFLNWLNTRPEKVVVVSSHSGWSQSLCSLILKSSFQNGVDAFKDGEMRSIGIKFYRR
jgi:hypothetical protein